MQELKRWQQTRADGFARMLASLAVVEHTFHHKSACVWKNVAADLAAKAERSGGSGPSTE